MAEKEGNKEQAAVNVSSDKSAEGNAADETNQGGVGGVDTQPLPSLQGKYLPKPDSEKSSKIESRASLLEKIWVGLAITLTVGLLCWFGASIWVLLLKSPAISAAAASPPKVEIIFSPIIQTMKNGPQGDVAFVYDTASMERQIQLWQPRINQAFGDAYESAMKDKTEAMQTRISDTWSAVQGIGLISAVIGVLITVVVLYFSFANADQINSAKAEMFADAKVELNKYLNEKNVLQDALEIKLQTDSAKDLLSKILTEILDSKSSKELLSTILTEILDSKSSKELLSTILTEILDSKSSKELLSTIVTEIFKRDKGIIEEALHASTAFQENLENVNKIMNPPGKIPSLVRHISDLNSGQNSVVPTAPVGNKINVTVRAIPEKSN